MIKQLEISDLPAVVALHYQYLYWSINGQLGKEHIAGMYHRLFQPKTTFGFGSFRNGRLLGFITGTLDWHESRACISSSYNWKKKIRMLLNSLQRPVDFLDILESTMVIPRFLERLGVKEELITWVTDETNPSHSLVALECMKAALDSFAKRGCSSCVAQVLRRNKEPNRFYISLKAKLVKSFLQNNMYLVDCRQNTLCKH